jgi:hypothetical protein
VASASGASSTSTCATSRPRTRGSTTTG